MSEENNKPTNEVAEVSPETLHKLARRDDDIRQSGVLDIFEQQLPQIPKDYVFKPRERKFVEDTFQVAFDMFGGVPRQRQPGSSGRHRGAGIFPSHLCLLRWSQTRRE